MKERTNPALNDLRMRLDSAELEHAQFKRDERDLVASLAHFEQATASHRAFDGIADDVPEAPPPRAPNPAGWGEWFLAERHRRDEEAKRTHRELEAQGHDTSHVTLVQPTLADFHAAHPERPPTGNAERARLANERVKQLLDAEGFWDERKQAEYDAIRVRERLTEVRRRIDGIEQRMVSIREQAEAVAIGSLDHYLATARKVDVSALSLNERPVAIVMTGHQAMVLTFGRHQIAVT